MNLKHDIGRLKKELDVTIVAHYYQNDAVFECADITGDSLELAKKAKECKSKNIVFCGVSFMGESVKILDPSKRVFMPRLASCSMAEMIDGALYDLAVAKLEEGGVAKDEILPITYINSSALIKSKVGEAGGLTCTSSNARKIMQEAKNSGKKIFFLPDWCLGTNMAKSIGLSSTTIGKTGDFRSYDVICFNGFCSVHQLFEVSSIIFYREKYAGIKIAVHPECRPEVCDMADFVGSTSQIIEYVKALPLEQKVAIGTEFNLVNRLRKENTYVLSSTAPLCPSMGETTIEDLHTLLSNMKEGSYKNEVFVEERVAKGAKLALDRMMEASF